MKSGYGLEMRAAGVCRKHHLLPTQSVHYQDPTHMETTREADVVVRFGNRLIESGDWLTVTAVIECKSSKGKPWAALLVPHTVSGSLAAALVAYASADEASVDEASLVRLIDTWKGSRRSPMRPQLALWSRCMLRMGKIRRMTITPRRLLSVRR
jgi:hypothetical protein